MDISKVKVLMGVVLLIAPVVGAIAIDLLYGGASDLSGELVQSTVILKIVSLVCVLLSSVLVVIMNRWMKLLPVFSIVMGVLVFVWCDFIVESLA